MKQQLSVSVLTSTRTAVHRQWLAWSVVTLSVFFILIHLYAGLYSPPDSMLFRSIHTTTALALVLLTKPLANRLRGLDYFYIAVVVWVQIYFFIELETWNIRTVLFRPIDYVTSILFVFVVLEATRRVVGSILTGICVFFMLHALFANYFPGIFYGPPTSLKNLLQTVFLDSNGIFGTAIAVMANFVVLFILFGTLLNACGGGAFFTRIAFALFGHRVGGPAKAAVVSSAMMGSLSGSAIGNVLTTGVFTIPLMIRLGYKRAFAGGVEAAASNGGIIMPPVMGAVAFIMAEFVDRPYLDIVVAAIIPALLYFLVIFISVHTEAQKNGLPTIDKNRLPSAWKIFKTQGYLVLPIILIIVALIAGKSIVYVATMICAVTFVIALLQPRNRITPIKVLEVAEQTARATVGLSAAAASAGILLGAIFSVGLSFQIAQAAASAADDKLWLLLLLSALMSLIMGMGMTAVAIYLTLVATIIPILKLAGVPPIAAHFFAFYYGIISNITPPVALTAFAAAPIARAGPMEVGVQASRMGIACFLLPILFVYSPGLLFEGPWYEIIRATFVATIGLVSFATAATGYAYAPMPLWQRVGGVLALVLCITPIPAPNIVGLLIAAIVFASNYKSSKNLLQDSNTDSTNAIEADVQNMGEDEAGEDDILASIMNDPPGEKSQMRNRYYWISWTVFVLLFVAIEICSQLALQARSPLIWAGVMMLLSIGLVVGVAMSWRQLPLARVDEGS
ncbi:MAG: TRAP transporter 4TM/12TM fusion protein [Gammaproteobacteria bacterium]|jgi:TRAP transporter 4TM/12TM fusion protein